jgi:hypothetical protein
MDVITTLAGMGNMLLLGLRELSWWAVLRSTHPDQSVFGKLHTDSDDMGTWVVALNGIDHKLTLFDGNALIEPGSDGEFHLFVVNGNSGVYEEVETDRTPYGVVTTFLLLPVTKEMAIYFAPEKMNYQSC